MCHASLAEKNFIDYRFPWIHNNDWNINTASLVVLIIKFPRYHTGKLKLSFLCVKSDVNSQVVLFSSISDYM